MLDIEVTALNGEAELAQRRVVMPTQVSHHLPDVLQTQAPASKRRHNAQLDQLGETVETDLRTLPQPPRQGW